MSWATRRQFKYLLGVFIFLGLIVFAFAYPVIFKDPTCQDGKKNGKEKGIDCGGSCSLMCKSDIVLPVVLWSRAFPVIDNNYNLVAYVENRNKDSAVFKASYEFRIYDNNNKLLGRKEGVTFIPPNQQFAVFESRFNAGQGQIKTVTFEFLDPLIWVKKAPTLQKLEIRVSNIVFDNNKDTPNLSAIINNDSVYNLPEFNVIAILYDENHNAINVSKTYKDKLMSNNSVPVFFTWPEVLSDIPVVEDVIISINPFSVSF